MERDGAEPIATVCQAEGRLGGEADPRARELSRLFEQHNRQLVSFLTSRLGNEVEARDVAQEAYVRLLQLDRPGAVSFLRAYLYRTASNIATDRIRHRTRSKRFEDSGDPVDLTDTVSPDRQVLAREALGTVRQALLELPDGYRRAFLLSRLEHRDTADVGRELGLKGTQVRLYLRRAVAYCALRLEGLTEVEAREQVFP